MAKKPAAGSEAAKSIAKGSAENVHLSAEEKAIIFLALGFYQERAEKIGNSAVDLAASHVEDEAVALTKKIETLRNKFL